MTVTLKACWKWEECCHKIYSCANRKVLHFIYQAYTAPFAGVEMCTLHQLVDPSRPGLKNPTITADCSRQVGNAVRVQQSIDLSHFIMYNDTDIPAEKSRCRTKLIGEAIGIEVNSNTMRGRMGSLWADHTTLLFTPWRKGFLIRVKQTIWCLTLYKNHKNRYQSKSLGHWKRVRITFRTNSYDFVRVWLWLVLVFVFV
jgi:hypothetical protein